MMTAPHILSRFLLFATLMFLITGCADTRNSQSTGAFTINASGGKVALPDGAEVIIPPGALQTQKTIGITEIGEGAFSVSAFTPVGSFYRLTPTGQTFGQPVSIFLPYDLALVGSATSEIRIYISRNAGASFESLPAIAVSQPGKVGGQTTHFSIVVAGLPQGNMRNIPVANVPEQPSQREEERANYDDLHDGCQAVLTAGCGGCPCEAAVCEVNSLCCASQWSSSCSLLCSQVSDHCGDLEEADIAESFEEDSIEPSPMDGEGEGAETTEDTTQPPVNSCENICGELAPSGCSCAPGCLAEENCCEDACTLCTICEVGCGNGQCESGETCKSCPEDCGECSFVCGDGICGQFEDCEGCKEDCCTEDAEDAEDCGNQVCDEGESCQTCAEDCQPCSCVGSCNEYNTEISCYCDEGCHEFGDCCPDACDVCGVCPPEN